MYNYNRDLIYFIKRDGTTQNPYNNINENINILYEKAFLEEVPVEAFRVVARVGNTTLSEVGRLEDVKTTNQYYVNYKQGIVHFHSSKNDSLVSLNYKGQGVLLYPASRIYIDSENGIVKTLKDLINSGRDAVDAIETINVLIARAESVINEIETLATTATNALNLINNKIIEIDSLEVSRVLAENIRKSNEDGRISAEISRVNADSARAINETLRVNAENTRINSETARINAENIRITNETARVNAENTRNTRETARQSAESTRVSSENARISNETNRNNKESERQTNETNRINAENVRNSNELERQEAETDRINAELLRKSQETQRLTDFQDAISNVSTAITNAQTATVDTINATTDANNATLEAREIIDKTVFKGDFDIDELYDRNNMVSYNGSSFIAKQPTQGNLPTNQDYWGMIARKGIDGTGAVSSVNDVFPDENGNVYVSAESMGAERVLRKGVAGGYAGLDSNAKIPLLHIPDMLKQQTYVVLDATARNALTNLISGDKAYETSTGNSYIYDGSQWRVLADADWENVSLEWVNIINRPNSTVQSIDLSVLNSHTHSNKEVLDGFAIINGKLHYDGANIGNVDSVNGMTGVVTITSASVGAYSKAEIDTKFSEHINNQTNKHIEILNSSPNTFDKRGVLFIKKGEDIEAPDSNVSADLYRRIQELTSMLTNGIDCGIFPDIRLPDIGDIDGGYFNTPYTGNPIDGGYFNTPYAEEDIDGGFFPAIEDVIDGGLFTSSYTGDPIDGGYFNTPYTEEDIDGGEF